MSYAVYIFLSHENGLINRALTAMGKTPIQWYNEPEYWPFIITVVVAVTQIGMASLYFYSALLSIDTQLFEAAEIDGAGKFKQALFITLPGLMPTVGMLLILKMGSLFGSSFELVYGLQNPIGWTQEVISTVVYKNGIGRGEYSISTALSLMQGAVALILTFTTNHISKKLSGVSMW